MSDELLIDALKEAKVLGAFKQLCEKNTSTKAKNRLRNIYSHTTNECITTKNLFFNELNIQIDSYQAERLTKLMLAFLKKSTYRKPISEKEKNALLLKQHDKCAICGNKTTYKKNKNLYFKFSKFQDAIKDLLESKRNLWRSTSRRSH